MKTVGQYRLIKKLGEGAFGVTMLAEHIPTGKKVCLKQEATGHPDAVALFKQEALVLWDLHHESIVPVKDYFEAEIGGDTYQFIAMNYIGGGNLQSFVEKHGFIDDEHICWMLQVCLKAFSYMHYHTVVHGDIKPENMMIQLKEHNIVLVDFGMAVRGTGAKMRAKGGTPVYIPPEFSNGRPPIPESDLYSLGKSALYLAGGDACLDSGNPPDDMEPALQKIIQAMIRRDPTARPGSAHEVQKQLTEFRRDVLGRGESQEILRLRNGTTVGTPDEVESFLKKGRTT